MRRRPRRQLWGEGSKAHNIVAGRLTLSIACAASVMLVPIELTEFCINGLTGFDL